jgi:GMP synthase-like glutamine amidotransferase
MAVVTIFRFSRTEGPGYFAAFLDRHRIPWRVVALDAGEPVPATLEGIAGIGLMGGPMSVNDELPWVAPMSSLLRDAIREDVPVIGHCLGGQLLAKALGVAVTRSPNAEIGWHDVEVEPTPYAQEWFGGMPRFRTFEWHNETFALPPGATRVLTNAACANQAYVIGNSIGLQSHVEMTRELVEIWVEDGGAELEPPRATRYVQSAFAITADLDRRLDALHRVADTIYARWIAGLRLGEKIGVRDGWSTDASR